jgi:Spy/CpxP family protein refolding chaperone
MKVPSTTNTVARLAIVVALALASAIPAAAQRARGRASVADAAAAAAAPDAPGVTPAEIQRMFDSYALIQAQDQLKITDEKFPQFLTRFKALQDTRRRNMTERFRMVQDLRKLSNDAQPDDTQMRDRLKALDELDVRSQTEIAKAYEAINQVLDIRQQAKFRVFEENMENRKLALVMRARQANRPKL